MKKYFDSETIFELDWEEITLLPMNKSILGKQTIVCVK